MDAVADRYADVPAPRRADFASAFARPYTAKPPRGAPLRSTPVHCAPLAAALHKHPELDAALVEELRLNHWLSPEDIETYFAALDSEWSAIRDHAAWSLVVARLNRAQQQRYADALDRFASDPALAASVDDLRRIFRERSRTTTT